MLFNDSIFRFLTVTICAEGLSPLSQERALVDVGGPLIGENVVVTAAFD